MEQQSIHIGNLIKEVLKKEDRSVAWLAKKISCDRSNLGKLLECPHLPSEKIRQISKNLNHDFFKDYSDDLQRHRE